MASLSATTRTPGNVELKAEGVEAVGGGRKGMCGDCCAVAPFRRNALDTFLLRALPDTGDIKQIEIGHDDAGSGSGEHLHTGIRSVHILVRGQSALAGGPPVPVPLPYCKCGGTR